MTKAKFLCLTFSLLFLIACSEATNSAIKPSKETVSQIESEQMNYPNSVKFAQFNVSFAHDGDPSENYEQWVKFMGLSHQQQNQLIEQWQSEQGSEQDAKLAQRVIQIRNIAAIIQSVRPDVLLLNEFNNDGLGEDYAALRGFQNNYLNHSQSLNSIDGGDLQEPIVYPFVQNFATNTGLSSGIDLNNNGFSASDPNDAFGFGFYHGHYAFALMSKYEIDTENMRSFQTFKRKDLPGAVMPVINVCDGSRDLPESLKCGDNWFNAQAWEALRLSSKNHVDAPILIPSQDGNTIIHALLAHPTPPAFDTVSDNNKYRNSEENLFWLHYINESSEAQGADVVSPIYDDKGERGGLRGENFVIMGDLNADAQIRTGRDPRFNGIEQLMSSPMVNQTVAPADAEFTPSSQGAAQAELRRPHPFARTRTSTFGARADYSVPSASLRVVDSGVYWQAEGEAGRLLFNDKRIGERGSDKEVSSDHRLVWVTIALD
jgi:hypothetical protein